MTKATSTALPPMGWDAVAAPSLSRPVHELVAAVAARTPDAPAVVFGEQTVGYGELCERAARLAARLRCLGVGPGALVGVSLTRGPRMVEALLGVLAAGAAYVPLDPTYPPARLALMVEDADPALVLTERGLPEIGNRTLCLDDLDSDSAEVADARTAVAPADLAYVTYTSGSTGRPKGVEITHGAVANFLGAMANRPGLHAEDRLMAVTSLSFDIAVLELFGPLVVGACCVIASERDAADGAALARLATEAAATVIQATPATWRLLAAEEWPQAKEVTALCGGEALPPDLASDLVGRVRSLWNLYGPTEATVWSTATRVTAADGPVPIGVPLPNTAAHVLDPDLRPVPVGTAGELCLGGAQLARGYRNQPDLTAAAFVDHPELGRLYRTGDRCRWSDDGQLEFVGRIDHQLKVRGFRVEPGEIEAALLAHPAVSQSVVIARGREAAASLTAYLVPGDAAPSAPELRSFLAERLPAYMVPSTFVTLAALPLTPNNKIDRASLPAPDEYSTGVAVPFVPPRTATERLLAQIWGEVLGVEKVGADENFLDMGGHSLLAARIAARIRESTGADTGVAAVFELPTIARLAAELDELTARESLRDAGPDTSTASRPFSAAPAAGPEPDDRAETAPLSFAQQRLWFVDRLAPGNPAYTIPVVLRLRGELDIGALRTALDGVVARHAPLRTSFDDTEGAPVQRVAAPGSAALAMSDLSAVPREEAAELAAGLVSDELARPFDLRTGPLWRASVIKLPDDEHFRQPERSGGGPGGHVLVIALHHVIADEWSVEVLTEELAQRYAAAAGDCNGQGPGAALPVQYADFAAWQRRRLEAGDLDGQLAYWRRQLAGAPADTGLPLDRPRPPSATLHGDTVFFAVDHVRTEALRRVSRQAGATLFMTLLAAYAVLLKRYSGRVDLVVGSPTAGRDHTKLEGLVGFFVNTLALRLDLSGDPSFTDLLARVRTVALDAFANAEAPFERLVSELAPQRDAARNPLFQVAFVLRNQPPQPRAGAGVTFTPEPVDSPGAVFDLTLDVTETSTGLDAKLNYASDLLDRATVERMAGHLDRLLASVAADPGLPLSRLRMLSDDDRRQLLGDWSGHTRDYPRHQAIHELIAEQVRRAPDATAIKDGERTLTYAELDRQANQLAHHLRARGAAPETIVGVCLPRGADQIVALTAVLKTGAAYLSLDRDHPAQRLAFMCADAGAHLLVGSQGGKLTNVDTVALDADAAAIASHPTAPPDVRVDGEALAYVIYTSGSTGTPKGVAIPHRAVTRITRNADYLQLGPDDVVAQASNASFDAAPFEIWGALTNGACLVVVPTEVLLSPPLLEATIRSERIGTLLLTTALFNQVAAELPSAFRPLRHLLFGGEAAAPTLVRRALTGGRPQRLLHMYGPAESATFATWHEVTDVPPEAATVPIGRPLANTTVFILDADRCPVPVGVTGELHVGGDGLARGYLHHPELTAERFTPSPFDDGARLYATGDLARWRADGTIEFAGRRDGQVKVRGFRIELGEVEARLSDHPAVRETAVLALETPRGGSAQRQLVAYVVTEPPGSGPPEAADGRASVVAGDDLRRFLAEILPDYMVPTTFVPLAALPLTPHGKLDRAALPVPDAHQRGTHTDLVPPATEIEQQLAGIWAELLDVDAVGRHDDFFALGGHSLLATRLASRVRDAWDVDLPLRVVFESSRLDRLARAIDESAPSAAAPQPPALKRLPRTPQRR